MYNPRKVAQDKENAHRARQNLVETFFLLHFGKPATEGTLDAMNMFAPVKAKTSRFAFELAHIIDRRPYTKAEVAEAANAHYRDPKWPSQPRLRPVEAYLQDLHISVINNIGRYISKTTSDGVLVIIPAATATTVIPSELQVQAYSAAKAVVEDESLSLWPACREASILHDLRNYVLNPTRKLFKAFMKSLRTASIDKVARGSLGNGQVTPRPHPSTLFKPANPIATLTNFVTIVWTATPSQRRWEQTAVKLRAAASAISEAVARKQRNRDIDRVLRIAAVTGGLDTDKTELLRRKLTYDVRSEGMLGTEGQTPFGHDYAMAIDAAQRADAADIMLRSIYNGEQRVYSLRWV